MRRVRVLIERQATVHDTHFLDIPDAGEDDAEQYVIDLHYDEGLPEPFSSEVVDFDGEINILEVNTVVEAE
jgi:hypothetical protein